MRLRFPEDRRTLLYAFALMPGNALLGITYPALCLFLTPLALYFAYVAGVLSHNHNHCPTFVGARSNRAYAAWLSIFYGVPILAWIPTHNQNHHRYGNGEGDVTRTGLLAREDSVVAWLRYPFAASVRQLELVGKYLRAGNRPNRARMALAATQLATLVLAHAGLLALAVGLHGVRGLAAYCSLGGLPALLAPYFMMLTNYQQHVGCDADSRYDYCRNFVGPFWNSFVFDNGYHTVHHEWPGVHWSRYRRLHAQLEARIDARLNQRDPVTYLLGRYFGAGRARAYSEPSESSLGCTGNPAPKPML